jgi:hypothetical protein
VIVSHTYRLKFLSTLGTLKCLSPRCDSKRMALGPIDNGIFPPRVIQECTRLAETIRKDWIDPVGPVTLIIYTVENVNYK